MIQFEKFTLANGLKVIVHEDFSTPLATINLLYDVGARDEDEAKTGFAHLFEHLMFGGSVNIPSYDTPLQEAGGENNAFTSNDITNYYLTLPANNIETGFWLESDRMLSLAFSEKSLEVQRNVVIEEFKQRYLNQPYGDVWLLLRELAYQVHPYKWNTIGKEIKHIEDATMDDVKDFFKTHYHPSNAVLVVAGAIKLEQVKGLTEKWFAPIPAQTKKPRLLPKEPVQIIARRLVVERNVPATAIYKAYHIADRMHADYYAHDLISDILGRGQSSRLHQALVKEKELFTEIGAYLTGNTDPGLLVISGKIREDVSVEVAELAIEEVLQKFMQEGVGERELAKVKNKAESTYAFEQMGISNIALTLAFWELMGDANLASTELERIQAVTIEKANAEIAKILVPTNCNTLIYKSKAN